MNIRMLPAILLVACGGGWSDADTKAATNATKMELLVEARCGADDASTCDPASVRALERAAYCANASMLYRHDAGAKDAAIECQP